MVVPDQLPLFTSIRCFVANNSAAALSSFCFALLLALACRSSDGVLKIVDSSSTPTRSPAPDNPAALAAGCRLNCVQAPEMAHNLDVAYH